MDPLPLGASIRRGSLIVAANWPIILIDVAVESFCRLALALPIVGGALVVTTFAGSDLQSVLADGVRATADLVVGGLATEPLALATFLAAVALVAVGGEAVLFIVKAGTLAVIAGADARAGDLQQLPLSAATLGRVRVFALETVVESGRHFSRRGIVLALWLGLVYAAVGGAYLSLVHWGLADLGAPWMPAWSVLVLLATSAVVVIVGVANLAYTLLRVVIVTDDCGIGEAVGRLGRFVMEDARQVIGVFAVIAGIEILAGAVALVAAGGLAPIGYLPVATLLLLPLQAALWVVRSLIFEALSLVGVAAYQTQYRRFGQARGGVLSAARETAEDPLEALAVPPAAPEARAEPRSAASDRSSFPRS
jgi:hypothetical protein